MIAMMGGMIAMIFPFPSRPRVSMLRHSREGENPERGLMSFRAERGISSDGWGRDSSLRYAPFRMT